MKILQLCHKTPLPTIDGGCIAIHNITKCLLDSGMDVKVVAVATPKHPYPARRLVRPPLASSSLMPAPMPLGIIMATKDGAKPRLMNCPFRD